MFFFMYNMKGPGEYSEFFKSNNQPREEVFLKWDERLNSFKLLYSKHKYVRNCNNTHLILNLNCDLTVDILKCNLNEKYCCKDADL